MSLLAECFECKRKQSLRNKKCIECGSDIDKQKRSKKVRYWVNYRLPGGKQRREPVGYSIEEAKAAEGKVRGLKFEKRILDVKKDNCMTFKELSEWYLKLDSVKCLASYWLVKITLNKFNSVFGNTFVDQIKPADLENYQAKRKKEGKAPATIDHEIGKAKTVVIKAFYNDLVSGEILKAFKSVKKILKRGEDVRDRILTVDEFKKLEKHSPEHFKPILKTAYYTGMRRGEILTLTWDRVDLQRRVIELRPIDTKNRKRRTIPICSELIETLMALPNRIHEIGDHNHVFLSSRGKSYKDIRKALTKACKSAGIKYGRFIEGGFIFHDLRHTFNTNMRKAGVAESVIMKITGHSTREMFDRYNTVDEEDTKKAVELFENFVSSVDDTLTKTQKKHS